jgi:probable phosphoglycerate mutase
MPPAPPVDWKTTFPTSTRVILVRHGQSTYNAEKRHQGSSDDSVLTAKGRLTAYQTGLLLRELDIHTLYCSPLRRTQETAQEMMAAIATKTDHRPKRVTHSALKEISLPAWEGLPYQVVREEFAEEYRCWKDHPEQFQMVERAQVHHTSSGALTLVSPPKPCHPVLELYDRAQQFWQEILPQHPGKTLVVVSHSGTNRALISTATGIAAKHFHRLQQSNCGVSILHFPNAWKQSTRLEAMNGTVHLGEALPKLKEGKQGLRLLLVPSNGNNPDQIQILTKQLESVEIDFCINHDSAHSQATAAQLLQPHPNTIQLPVLREDFFQAWQQSLISNLPKRPLSESLNRPLTALIVVREEIALLFLSQLLKTHPQHLHLKLDTLSVIHYPHRSNFPVLQAMNCDLAN